MALALIHAFAGRLKIQTVPRSIWLSFAGGCSVAYVFVQLLPELARGQVTLSSAAPVSLRFLEHHAYLMALAGLALFYGLERAAVDSRQARRNGGGPDETEPGIFWLNTAAFAVYNLLIGYALLHREQPGARSLALFFVAMGLHFVVNDAGLREHHKGAYDRVGRWVLAMAILAGWGVGVVTEISEAALAMPLAVLAGGVILNVLKEELPEQRKSRFKAFAAGAAVYAAIGIGL